MPSEMNDDRLVTLLRAEDPYDDVGGQHYDRIAGIVRANRWAAFTDDELRGLDDCFSHYTVDDVHHLVDEVDAELERRRGAAS